ERGMAATALVAAARRRPRPPTAWLLPQAHQKRTVRRPVQWVAAAGLLLGACPRLHRGALGPRDLEAGAARVAHAALRRLRRRAADPFRRPGPPFGVRRGARGHGPPSPALARGNVHRRQAP